MYSHLKKVLFKLDPELAHELSLDMLSAMERTKLIALLSVNEVNAPCSVMGLEFKNPVGLAAGLDKNGDYLNALGALGFGFVEIGTITPLAQSGNEKPRLFRLEAERAIINRMGFNNKGVDYLVSVVKEKRYPGILGINIGKNKLTPDEHALSDYVIGMTKVYTLADYITINISSPNTPGLRNLQFGDSLKTLLSGIRDHRKSLQDQHQAHVPIAVKISPDSTTEELEQMAEQIAAHEMDAIIATNTTIDRLGVAQSLFKDEVGGLSGLPLRDKSTEVISTVKTAVGEDLPIIGVGGIFSADDAIAKMNAGASLVQIYSGFIYEGPGLIKGILQALNAR